GNNATIERDQAVGNFRLLEVAGSGTLHLHELTLRYGVAEFGGAIHNTGTLLITEVAAVSNAAFEDGGAIYNTGTLTVNTSDLSYNTASLGGGILNTSSGNVSVVNSRFRSNVTWRGAGIYSFGAVDVNQSVFTDNHSGEGAAIQAGNNASIHNTCLVGNNDGEFGGWAVFNLSSNPIDATNNWWGAADGPSGNATGSGDAIFGNVTYTSFLTSAPSHCAVVVTPTPTITLTPSHTPTTTFTPTAVATCTVTVPAGDVASLVSAMQAANLAPDMDVICLTQSTYTLTAPTEPEESTDTGLPIVYTPMIIRGNNAILERVRVEPNYRLLEVAEDGELHLFNLTLRYGEWDNGGAIRNEGGLTLTDVSITDNRSGDAGGGVYNSGSLEVRSSDISRNWAWNDGGAIYNTGELTIFDSRIRANEGGWGAGIGGAGTLTVERSVFTENWAYWTDGGGFFIGGATRLNNSCIFGNLAEE